jgi:hypothetical protein
MLDDLKALLATRGAQLMARYVATLLVALGARASISIDANNATACAGVIAQFVVAGILYAIDHWAHSEQQKP